MDVTFSGFFSALRDENAAHIRESPWLVAGQRYYRHLTVLKERVSNMVCRSCIFERPAFSRTPLRRRRVRTRGLTRSASVRWSWCQLPGGWCLPRSTTFPVERLVREIWRPFQRAGVSLLSLLVVVSDLNLSRRCCSIDKFLSRLFSLYLPKYISSVSIVGEDRHSELARYVFQMVTEIHARAKSMQ